jgi:hypothetical protein
LDPGEGVDRCLKVSRMPARRTPVRRPAPPSDVPRLRLSAPDDVLAAVPYLLGFHPERSLVVLGLAGPRGQLGVTMRMDLEGMPVGDMACRVARALQEDADTQAILLVYDPAPLASDRGSERDRHRLQPGEDVVAAVRSALRRANIRLREAMRVSDGRWWSYLCDDPGCCPPEGSLVKKPETPGGPSLVAATAVVAGMSALPDRASLAARLEPPAPWTHEATAQALDRVGEQFAARCASDVNSLADTVLGRIGELRDRFAGRRPTLTDDEVAHVALGLHLLDVRDTVITWTVEDSAPALIDLLVEVVRRTGAPEHVPAATVLAWSAYLHGKGALAGVALELVARSEPDYSLAGLVDTMLQHGIHPDRLRDVTLATAEELRQRRAGAEAGRQSEKRPGDQSVPDVGTASDPVG